jgi:hypothetical protein
VNQFALFTLMSGARTRLDHWLVDHSDTGYRVIIPAELKVVLFTYGVVMPKCS